MCRSNVGRPKQGVKFTLCGNSGPANGQCIGREGDWTWPFAGPRPAARVDAPVERAGACGWMVTRARPRSSQPSASRFGRDQSALVAPQIEARAPQAVATPVQFDTRGTVHSLRGTHASSARPALTSARAKRARARDPGKGITESARRKTCTAPLHEGRFFAFGTKGVLVELTVYRSAALLICLLAITRPAAADAIRYDNCATVGAPCNNALAGGAPGATGLFGGGGTPALVPGICQSTKCLRGGPDGTIEYDCQHCVAVALGGASGAAPSASGGSDGVGCDCSSSRLAAPYSLSIAMLSIGLAALARSRRRPKP